MSVVGHVSLVGAGPGDPSLLTRQALLRLRRADLVLYDALVDERVVALARRAQRFFVGKRAGRHALSQQDIHIIMIPSPGGPVPTPLPHPFNGTIGGSLSTNVKVMGKPVAVLGSTADNMPHIPQGGPFQKPPMNRGTIITGSPRAIQAIWR